MRDWIYVKDHCKAVDYIIHHGRAGEVYNVGGNCEMKNIDVVKRILSELKKSESLIQYVVDRTGHDLRYAVDYNKVYSELGWENEMNFNDGIKSTIKWYIDNENWWKNFDKSCSA